MEEIDKENLEKAINSSDSNHGSRSGKQDSEQPQKQQGKEMSREMEIGFHQGALNTLNKERSELLKMAQNVESIMQMHVKRLKELGVDIQFQNQKQPEQRQQNQPQDQ